MTKVGNESKVHGEEESSLKSFDSEEDGRSLVALGGRWGINLSRRGRSDECSKLRTQEMQSMIAVTGDP